MLNKNKDTVMGIGQLSRGTATTCTTRWFGPQCKSIQGNGVLYMPSLTIQECGTFGLNT